MTATVTRQDVEAFLRHRREALERITADTEKLRKLYEQAVEAGAAQERTIRRSPVLRAGRAICNAIADSFVVT